MKWRCSYFQAALQRWQLGFRPDMKSLDHHHVRMSLAWASFTAVLIQEFVDVGLGQAVSNLDIAHY